MIEIVIAAAIGAGVGVGGFMGYQRTRQINGKNQIERDLADAKTKASDIVLKAKDEALKIENERRREWQKTENRLADREKTLDNKLEELDRRAEKLRAHEDEVDSLKNEIRDIRTRQQEKLEKIAGLKKKDAADKLMQMTERDIKQDLAGLVSKLQHDAMDDAEERAQMILVAAMERMSSEVTAERTVTAVKLTDDEMKGRIIGKEGRNIQALQRETGVDILVDDTPGMIVLSSFDPIRRQVARLSLEMLMKDGRIHPARIEEVVAKAKKQIDKEVKQAGEDAAREVGVVGIPKEMLRMLGELKFRTSFGQNVLKQSLIKLRASIIILVRNWRVNTAWTRELYMQLRLIMMTSRQLRQKRLLCGFVTQLRRPVQVRVMFQLRTLLNECAIWRMWRPALRELIRHMQYLLAVKFG